MRCYSALVRGLCVYFAGGVLLGGIHSQAASRFVVPDYRIGETSKVHIFAPFVIEAVDGEATAKRKLNAAATVPTVVRWQTNTASICLGQFHDKLMEQRSRFMREIVDAYGRGTLDASAAEARQFSAFVETFSRSRAGLPVALPLARAWATNGDDDLIINLFEQRFEAAATRLICADGRTPEGAVEQIRLIGIGSKSAVTTEMAESATKTVSRSQLAELTPIRSEFAQQFSEEFKSLARAAALMLEVNCEPEPEITQQLRGRRTADVWSVHRFDPGDTIVDTGDVITPIQKAALEQLRMRLLALQVGQPQSKPTATPTLLAAACAAILILLALVWWRHRRTSVARPVKMPASAPHDDPALRAGVAAGLTRLLGHRLVRTLVGDREQLLRAQAAAGAQASHVEAQLEDIQSVIAHRYQYYEGRIAELERQLAAAESDQRLILTAELVQARRDLEIQRTAGQN